MTSITLSFCIPTYNRCEVVIQLVKDILNYETCDIEVIVLDNGSTDATLQLLSEIVDKRLSIYSNGTNKGALFNMINVLDRGTGQYLVYCTDQDHVVPEQIIQFKNFLMANPNIYCGFCEFSNQKKDHEIFSTGFDSINKVAYLGCHPTGYFFQNKPYKIIDVINRFSDYNFVDLFPLEFVFAELCVQGSGAIYRNTLFIPETRKITVEKQKSLTTTGTSISAFFSPDSRLKMSVNYAKHITSLNISNSGKDNLKIKTFLRGLIAATVGYRDILKNETLCKHYHMELRDLSVRDTVILANTFYNNYVEAIRANDREFNQLYFNLKLVRYIIKKLSFKLLSKLRVSP
jgi:glycosyltransferase involved in cell wall biosynthesis